jgi:hypothetical protein
MDYETAQQIFDALSAPFPAESIDWRVGATTQDKKKGMALAYIDARVVMDRFDTICGPDGWANNYTPAGNMLICNIGVQMPGGSWVYKSDGAGATDVEASKGMASDAFKRAAVRWGVGRYLYDVPSPWVELDQYKKIVPEARAKLDEIHDREAAKVGWGERSGVQVYRFLLHIVREHVRQPADVIEFREKNKGMIPLLPVAMRRHLESELDRIGGATAEAAE